MYDLNKCSYFTTVGELRMLLANLPNETEVCTSGVLGSYLHFDKDKDLISFDNEDLNEDPDAYPELDQDEEDELYLKRQEIEADEHDDRLRCIDEGSQFFFVGNKLMRTFLADDGSWDYELKDISLSVVDSGQLGEDRSMERKEVIDLVMSDNNLDKEKRYYISPDAGTMICKEK